MSELFNVSTDYLLKDDVENEVNLQKESIDNSSKIGYRKVSMEEAVEYMNLRENNAFKIALGVALAILSPAALLLLLAFLGTQNRIGVIIGIFALFIMVSIAIVLFINAENEGKPFDYMANDRIETAYGVRGMVKEKEKEFASKYSMGFALGIVICILSPFPTIAGSLLSNDNSILLILCSTILIFVAIGMFLVIKFSIIKETYSILLKEGEYSDEEREVGKKLEKYAPIY